jgi:hypothetical protein
MFSWMKRLPSLLNPVVTIPVGIGLRFTLIVVLRAGLAYMPWVKPSPST